MSGGGIPWLEGGSDRPEPRKQCPTDERAGHCPLTTRRRAPPTRDPTPTSEGGTHVRTAAAAHHHIRVIAVEPERCCALRAALDAGRPVDVQIDSIAADALGARRVSGMALTAAQTGDVRSVLVSDEQIINTRQHLWETRRIAVEHGAATALAALHPFGDRPPAYPMEAGERIVVVLCGANTDPGTLQPHSEDPI